MLLVNLGTPDGTDYTSMRRYLREFLTDRRVIEWSRFKWYPILFGIVLNTRPRKVGKAYELIWNKERNESYPSHLHPQPGRTDGASASADLSNVVVDWAMRYGQPVDRLAHRGAEAGGLRPDPALPALSAICRRDDGHRQRQGLSDAADHALAAGAAHACPPYHDDPAYIEALANSLTRHLATLDWEPEVILASFHGIPQSYFDKGDPYYCHCQKTARLLRERLGLSEDKLHRHLPVALRTGGMAAALYRQDGGEARAGTA